MKPIGKSTKPKTHYVCAECGASSLRWLGRCPGCGAWNSLAEERTGPRDRRARPAAARPVALGDVKAEGAQRLETGLTELDRVLGGGPVAGSVVLLAGDPGIGKSTLLMQALASLAGRGHRALYVSGEESASQLALRGRRLRQGAMDQVRVLTTTELTDVEAALAEPAGDRPAVAVIDSIQTLRSPDLDSAAGTVGQLREVTARLVERAKGDEGVCLFLIGHVTKEGMIAGPKVLEHQVDTVLSFEGDHTHSFRILRATKNRFGPSGEIGVFEMLREGLREVADPSALFLAERPLQAAGSIVVPTAEGSRPLLVEVQALVAPAVYGAARRVASGIDSNRLAILLAVLDRKAKVHVADRDVFASLAGGARVDERAIDLALAVAVVSSLQNMAVAPELALFGEVGLAGEVRAVPRAGPRIAEARKLGFRTVIVPKGNAERLTVEEQEGCKVVAVSTLVEALSAAL
jgi:DNA repair protein RadA/Sms